MTLGKSLRMRRVFANGRALMVDCEPLCEDPPARVRALARGGVDAVILTPGMLDVVAEELGPLSVILRIDSGGRRLQQLISVQSALTLGADGILASMQGDCLERFGQLTEEARRLGMPVFAEISGPDWLETARLCADCGADVIQARFLPDLESCRHFQRMTGRPVIAMIGTEAGTDAAVLAEIYGTIQGLAQGVVLCRRELTEPAMLEAIHGLVHQGISAEQATFMAYRRPAAEGQ